MLPLPPLLLLVLLLILLLKLCHAGMSPPLLQHSML
jgi:hypothetical protein